MLQKGVYPYESSPYKKGFYNNLNMEGVSTNSNYKPGT